MAFNTTPSDMRIIKRIVRRGQRWRIIELLEGGAAIEDLAACHATCPLLLADLAGSSMGLFAQDVLGIRHHIDRSTGKLHGFVPRFAKPWPRIALQSDRPDFWGYVAPEAAPQAAPSDGWGNVWPAALVR